MPPTQPYQQLLKDSMVVHTAAVRWGILAPSPASENEKVYSSIHYNPASRQCWKPGLKALPSIGDPKRQ